MGGHCALCLALCWYLPAAALLQSVFETSVLSQRQQGHLLPQPGGVKELLVGLAGHALLQPFGTEGTGPLWLLFSSVPLLL